MRHTLQNEHSPRFDFLPLQTYDNWRLRWDCQETRDKNNRVDKGEWHGGRWETEENEVKGKRRDEVTLGNRDGATIDGIT